MLKRATLRNAGEVICVIASVSRSFCLVLFLYARICQLRDEYSLFLFHFFLARSLLGSGFVGRYFLGRDFFSKYNEIMTFVKGRRTKSSMAQGKHSAKTFRVSYPKNIV